MRHPYHKPYAFKRQFRLKTKYEAMKEKYIDSLRICFEDFKVNGPKLMGKALNACEDKYTPLLMYLKRRGMISLTNLRWSYRRAEALAKIL